MQTHPCDSEYNSISPAGIHEPDVPAFSCSGSHLFGSDGGVGFPSFSPQSPLFGLIPFGVWTVRIPLESDESGTRGCESLERESGRESSPWLNSLGNRGSGVMLATTGLVCEATDRPSFSVQGSSAWTLGGTMPAARSLPPIVHQYKGKRERKVRVHRYKCRCLSVQELMHSYISVRGMGTARLSLLTLSERGGERPELRTGSRRLCLRTSSMINASITEKSISSRSIGSISALRSCGTFDAVRFAGPRSSSMFTTCGIGTFTTCGSTTYKFSAAAVTRRSTRSSFPFLHATRNRNHIRSLRQRCCRLSSKHQPKTK